MNRLKSLTILWLLLAPGAEGRADSDPLTVLVTAFRSADVASEADPAIQHVIGGQNIDLPLVIRGRSEKPVDLRARLVQLTSSLRAPLPTDVEVLSGRVLGDGEPIPVSVRLPLPAVRGETDFELQFQTRTEEEWHKVDSRARIRLYPTNILDPLISLSKNVALRLKDDTDTLRPLLGYLEVVVADHRAPVLRRGALIVTLVVNSDNAFDPEDLTIRENESVIGFDESVRTLPKVVKRPHRGGHLIHVELEVFKNLRSDPRAQKTFMEILKLAHPKPLGDVRK